MSTSELRELWEERIGWIAEEANYMAVHRYRFQYVERWLFRRRQRRIVNRSLQAFGWITKLWFTEGMMYVRRELDDQHGVINLNHLLHEIEARPDAIAGISPKDIAADQKHLRETCTETLSFAQQQLAHRAPMDDPFASLAGLDKSLDAIFHTVRSLHLLITAQPFEFTGLKPDPEWLQAFTVPWYRPGKTMRRRIKAVQRDANR